MDTLSSDAFEIRILAPNHASSRSPSQRSPRTLIDLAETFREYEEKFNPDVVVRLNQLAITTDENIVVPGLGEFGFSPWSKRQLSALLGLKWDRYFENASAQQRADEINRRLARSTEELRVRTTSDTAVGVDADGTLRGIVTPGFSPVEDSKVAGLVVDAMQGIDGEMKIIRADVSDRTTTFIVAIGRPYKVGGTGEVGDVWGGLMVRNSGVGFASLLMIAHLVRLVCRNGMTCPVPENELLRRRHRGIDETRMRLLLSGRLKELPGKLHRAGEVLEASTRRRVDDVEAEVRGVLDRANLPQRFLPAILDAYNAEPLPSAFGISQAVTLAAKGVSAEERLDLERAAGDYLRH